MKSCACGARAVIANPQTAFRFANILLTPEAPDTLPEGATKGLRELASVDCDEVTAPTGHFHQFVGKTRNIVTSVRDSTVLLSGPGRLLGAEPVQLILLLYSVLPLAVDGVETIRRSGGGCDLGALFPHQYFPALAFLQCLLLRILTAVQSLRVGFPGGWLRRPRQFRRVLDIPEFLLASPVQLNQLRHTARCIFAKGRHAEYEAEPGWRQRDAHASSGTMGSKSGGAWSMFSVYDEIAWEAAMSIFGCRLGFMELIEIEE